MKKLTFDCGCSFDIVGDEKSKYKILFSPKIEHINTECPATWEIISAGNTKGCFQLESRLGQMMAKKLKPENIEQLSGLISILRPGTLEAIRDGKSVTNHYIDKKNNEESLDYFHPCLEPILGSTYGEMIYQEQAMEIAKTIAGFDLQEADMLRKAIGKKKTDEMAKVKTKFLEGATRLGTVNQEEAEQIFSWIEKSQRYSFNKSHAVSYAMNAFLSAYTKAHFPQAFFVSYLKYAKDKIDPKQEIKQLVKNANEMHIDIHLPNLLLMNKHFVIHNNSIYFGLTDIKSVGESVFLKMQDLLKNQDISKMKWIDILIFLLLKINSSASKSLISAGALDYIKKNRTEMLFEFNLISSLTTKEIEYIATNLSNLTSISDCFLYLQTHPKVNIKRKALVENLRQSLKNPPYSLVDKIEWLADTEADLLGIAISCSKLDSYDIEMANTNCKDFKTTTRLQSVIIAGEISNINIVKTKKGKNPGQNMAFISIEDQYGSLESVVMFPEVYEQYKHHLFVENILVFIGSKNKSNDSLIVEKCFTPSS